MKVFIPVDDSNGLMFNNRRQSKDERLREYITKKCDGNLIWMNSYSAKQFEEDAFFDENGKELLIYKSVYEDFLELAKENDYCFVENSSLAQFEEKIDEIYLCKWNRRYPGDTFFDIDLTNGKWQMDSVDEFPGKSHEKIVVERWKRI